MYLGTKQWDSLNVNWILLNIHSILYFAKVLQAWLVELKAVSAALYSTYLSTGFFVRGSYTLTPK